MKKLMLLVVGMYLVFSLFAQKKDIASFNFNESQLVGFKKITLNAGQIKNYDHIYQSADQLVEVRYTFRPDMKNVLPADVETYTTALMLNLAKSKTPGDVEINKHSDKNVKGDYSGSAGYYAVFETDKSFSSEYPFCLAFLIYKEKVGAFTIFLLAKSQEDIGKNNHAQALAGKIISFKNAVAASVK